ncbi:MAG: polymorphic toxin type 50 domain-containing protein [Negativicoccus succinicivorans]|nr:polymorphic toxin type 50 domain-containing protein [Negativicoccus succinicivorans]
MNEEKQKPHMESTAGKGKSYLFDTVDPQELFDKYAGAGTIVKTRNGNNTNKEECVANKYIGIDVSSGLKTRKFKIHHSKSRTHIVPKRERENGRDKK